MNPGTGGLNDAFLCLSGKMTIPLKQFYRRMLLHYDVANTMQSGSWTDLQPPGDFLGKISMPGWTTDTQNSEWWIMVLIPLKHSWQRKKAQASNLVQYGLLNFMSNRYWFPHLKQNPRVSCSNETKQHQNQSKSTATSWNSYYHLRSLSLSITSKDHSDISPPIKRTHKHQHQDQQPSNQPSPPRPLWSQLYHIAQRFKMQKANVNKAVQSSWPQTSRDITSHNTVPQDSNLTFRTLTHLLTE